MEQDTEFEKTVGSYKYRLEEVKRQSSNDSNALYETQVSSSSSVVNEEETFVRSEVECSSSASLSEAKRLSNQGKILDLGEYSSLHRYFVFVAEHKQNKPKEEAIDLSLKWIQCWKHLGYTYRDLLACVAWHKKRVAEKLCPEHELQQKLWSKLNKYREQLPYVSISFVVDRTIEHYTLVLEKRMREREAMEARKMREKASTPSSESAPVASFSESEKLEKSRNPPQIEDQQVISSTTVDQKASSCDNNLVQIENDFYAFLGQKLLCIISDPIDEVSASLNKIKDVIKATQIHPTTLLAWYKIDCESNDGVMKYYSELLRAYIRPNIPLLPTYCPLDTLIKFIIEFCSGNPHCELYKNPNTYAAYAAAVKTLEARRRQQEHQARLYHQKQQEDQHEYMEINYESHVASSSFAPSTSSWFRSQERSLLPTHSTPMSTSSQAASQDSFYTKKKDASSIKFNHGVDPHLEEKPNHPLNKTTEFPNDTADFLKIFCHVEIIGEGLLGSDLLQIGACLENGNKETLFPVLPSANKYTKDILNKLYYIPQKSSSFDNSDWEPVKFCHPTFGDDLKCFSPIESLFKFVNFLTGFLAKSDDFDGVILIFGYQECLTHLISAILRCQSEQLKRKLCAVVRGFLVLEPSIRSYFLFNCQHDYRLSVKAAWNIVFNTSPKRLDTSAEAKAKAWSKIYSVMFDQGFRIDGICLHFDKTLLNSFQHYIERLIKMKSIRRRITKTLDDYRKPLPLSDNFELFPNLGCQEIVAEVIDRPKAVASIIVEHLVAAGLTYRSLMNQFRNVGPEQLSDTMMRAICGDSQEQMLQIEEIVNTCIQACLVWLHEHNQPSSESSKYRKRRRLSESPGQSSSLISSPIHAQPPIEVILSDEDFPSEPKLGTFESFRKHCCRAMAKSIPADVAEEVSFRMISVWNEAGYDPEGLTKRITKTSSSDDEILTAQFLFALKKRTDPVPSNWHGFGLEFLIEQTLDFYRQHQTAQIPSESDIVEFLRQQKSQHKRRKSEFPNDKSESEVTRQQLLDELGVCAKDVTYDLAQLQVIKEFRLGLKSEFQNLKKACQKLLKSTEKSAFLVLYEVFWLLLKDSLTLETLEKQIKVAKDLNEWKWSIINQVVDLKHTLQASCSTQRFNQLRNAETLTEILSKLLDILIENGNASEFKSSLDHRITFSPALEDQNILDRISAEYLETQSCPQSLVELHKFVYFHPMIRRLKKLLFFSVRQITDDIIRHLNDRCLNLNKSVQDLMTEFKNNITDIAVVTSMIQSLMKLDCSLPKSCVAVKGVLVKVLIDYLKCDLDSPQNFHPKIRCLDFKVNNRPLVKEFCVYICRHVFVEIETVLKDNGVEGLIMNEVNQNLVAIGDFTQKLVASAFESSFDISRAIQALMDGELHEYLKRFFKVKSLEKNFPIPTFISLFKEWIVAHLTQSPPRPRCFSKVLRKWTLVFLLADLLSVRRRSQLSLSSDYLSSFPSSSLEEINDLTLNCMNPQPLDTIERMRLSEEPLGQADTAGEQSDGGGTEPVMRIKSEQEVAIKVESDEGGEHFVDTFGFAKTLTDIELDPGYQMVCKLGLCGMPRLKRGSQMVISPNYEETTRYKNLDLEFSHKMLYDKLRLYITVINNGQESLLIPQGSLLVKTMALNAPFNPQGRKTESNPLKVVRYVIQNWGLSYIEDQGGYIHLGPGFDIEILASHSSGIPIARSESFGPKSVYSLGEIVYFLKTYRNNNIQSYIKNAMAAGINFVRFPDVSKVSKYMLLPNCRNIKLLEDKTNIKSEPHPFATLPPDLDMKDGNRKEALVHLKYEEEKFPRVTSKILIAFQERKKLSLQFSRMIFNNFLELMHWTIHGDLSKLRFEAFTSSVGRIFYEEAIIESFHNLFTGSPALFEQQEVVRDLEALATIPNPVASQEKEDLRALISLLSDDQATKQSGDTSLLLDLVQERRKSWFEIGDSDQLIFIFSTNDLVQSHLILSKGIEDPSCHFICCSSQKILDRQKSSQEENLLSYIISTLNEHSNYVQTHKITIQVDRSNIVDVCAQKIRQHHVGIGNLQFDEQFHSNPARLLLRDEQPGYSFWDMMKHLLSVSISIMCKGLSKKRKVSPLKSSRPYKKASQEAEIVAKQSKEFYELCLKVQADEENVDYGDNENSWEGMKCFFHKKLCQSNNHEQVVSSQDLIDCWKLCQCDMIFLQYEFQEKKSKKKFQLRLEQMIYPYKSLLPTLFPEKLLFDLTYSFFRMDNVGQLCHHDQHFPDSEIEDDFKALQMFYLQTLFLDEIEARKCARIWSLLSMSYQDLKSLCLLASECNDFWIEVRLKLGTILKQICILLPPNLDLNKFVDLTVTYFTAVSALEHSEQLQGVDGDSLSSLRKAVTRKIMKERREDPNRVDHVFQFIVSTLKDGMTISSLAQIIGKIPLQFSSTTLIALHCALGEKFPGLIDTENLELSKRVMKYIMICCYKLDEQNLLCSGHGEDSEDVEDGEVVSDDEEDTMEVGKSMEKLSVLLDNVNLKFDPIFQVKEGSVLDVAKARGLCQREQWNFAQEIKKYLSEHYHCLGDLVIVGNSCILNISHKTNFISHEDNNGKEFYTVEAILVLLKALNDDFGDYLTKAHASYCGIVSKEDFANIKNYILLPDSSVPLKDVVDSNVMTEANIISPDILEKFKNFCKFTQMKKCQDFPRGLLQCQDEEYRPVFEEYSSRLWNFGLDGLRNWERSCETIANYQVSVWTSSGLSWKKIEHMMISALELDPEEEAKLNSEKFKSVFRLLQDCLKFKLSDYRKLPKSYNEFIFATMRSVVPSTTY